MACSSLIAEDKVFISEFMAVNERTLADQDGDYSDWIELHNAGTNLVNLNGWYLTDKQSQLTEWRFPSAELQPNAYLIVFASGKDRHTSGAELHTNFKLSGDGEYLALVKPDGTNVVSAFAPKFPSQAAGVSYGVPVQAAMTTLLASGASARVLVPLDGSLGTSWNTPAFIDSGWLNLTTGVGFDVDGQTPFVPVPLANSVTEFSGVQGQANWFYGYWNKKTDADGAYAASEFVAFPNAGGGFGANNFWTGTLWDWFNGDPPFTQLTSQGGQPSGDNGNGSLPSHWAVRRYVSEANGPLSISGTLTHTSDWVYVTATGIAGTNLFYMYHLGPGDGYVDDIKLVVGATPEIGQNLLANGDFETGSLTPWNLTPNVSASAITTAVKHGGTRSLHLVSAAAGASQSTAIWANSASLVSGQIYTLSYWYLPATNSSGLEVRTSGRWLDTFPAYCGDGTMARIFVDGVQVFQQKAFVSSQNFAITVPAQTGSKIDFALDPGAANNDLCDGTIFTAAVQTADPNLAVVADSAADWSITGTQGEKNWFYGYYNRTADPDHTYQAANFTAFPRAGGPQSANNFWDEEEWSWFSGKPPFDQIGQYWMTPNGTNSGAEHWVIRRWVSEVSGTVTMDWAAFKELPDQNNSGGGGVTIHIFQNGIQRDSATVAGGDVVGVRRSLVLNNVQVGDLIDIALDPTNVDGRPEDDTDRTFVTAVMHGAPSLNNLVASNLDAAMRNINATAYLRLPFNVADPSVLNSLLLRMKFDDGFVAYLNGVEVARVNAPIVPAWNSAATAQRSDADNNDWQLFNLGTSLGLLHAGSNVLAFQGLNVSASDRDFLILPELIASTETFDLTARRYFMTPTPGGPNGVGNTNLGPLILSADHTPSLPRDADDLLVTTSVTPTFKPVASVRLIYRVMYSNEVNVPMFDDGLHGDGAAGDGVWGALIPANASTPGQMVRYYVFATDSLGNGSRFPAYEDPKNSPQYQGTVIFNPGLTNPLPVVQWFIQTPALASDLAGTRCSIFWDGEFFDNIGVNGHGQTTWQLPVSLWPNKSLDFNLNTGYKLRPKPGESRVKAFDLLSPYSDKAYMRLPLAFGTFHDAGVPTHFTFPVRVQQNNAFHSVMWLVEQANDDFLERNGLDGNGAMYKIYFPLTDPYTGAKKVTRQNEPNDDLANLISGLNLTGNGLRQYLFDNVDVAEAVNFFATIELVQNEDCCYYKNYYLYRDSLRTGEWQIFPWDLDLTFGRTFTQWPSPYNGLSGGYFDTNIFFTDAYFTEQRSTESYIGGGQPIFDAIWTLPETRDMFLRRWTSVQEQFLRKTNSHPLSFYFENKIDQFSAQLGPDAALDLAKWGTWPPAAPVVQSQAAAAQVLKTNYLAPRRNWIFNTLAYANGGPYLGAQPANATIVFGDLETNPSSGNQDQEYIQLRNTNNYSVDLSGWKISGGVDFTFRGGTVMPSNSVLYVSPNVSAFRARTSGPHAGLGLFVQGSYKGQLSARGEMLQLSDAAGRLVQATNFTGNPSLAQQYLRITEIMYHPAPPPPGLAASADEFEYIELKNIGPVPFSLAGVRFVNGIDFDFTAGSVPSLGAGQSLLLVKNVAAFASRYGSGLTVAGQYTGALDNAGETITLLDAAGEKILDFAYNNSWYPITDGFGFSLQIVNENAAWDTWGQKASWQPSRSTGGSPGLSNPPPLPLPPILVNEVLSHTDPPAVDAIELFNPTDLDVDVGGWYITDSFNTPKKFRIPEGITIYANDYLTFDEHWFNHPTNAPTSFSFSASGDEAYIFSSDADGNLTGYFHGFPFGAADAGVSFGRYVNSANSEHFVAQTSTSFWEPNAGPKVGPLVITRIMYHPPDLPGGSDNSDDEFVEVQNISSATVSLFDPAAPVNTWRLSGAVTFQFPTNLTIDPGVYMILANFNVADATKLAAFRAKYAVPGNVAILGPLSGKLANSKESVKLSKPGSAIPGGSPPYILVEAIDYDSVAPWPPEADGAGALLQRFNPSQYGNDPANWVAAAPAAGRNTLSGTPPSIVTSPASRVGFLSQSTSFSMAASGTGPLYYQWRLNGANLPGATNSVLTLTNLQFSQAGVYNGVVFNAAGSASTTNAVLTVQLPLLITQQPQSQTAIQGSNVAFTVSAVGNGPLTYQWRLNGTNIPQASNPTLTLTNVSITQTGLYVALITDGLLTTPTAPATLSVVAEPTIIQQPVSVSVPIGGTATLSVMVTNSATLPIGYRWRKGTTTVASNSLNSYVNFITLTNVQTSGFYIVTVFNAARPAGIASSLTAVTVLPDADLDGIPDKWETDNGFLANDPSDAAGDADGDGMTNLQEYIAGTNPHDANSYLKVDRVTLNSQATIQFTALSNHTYTIEFSDTLTAGSWSRLADILARTSNRVESVIDPHPGTNRFYRLATPQKP